ncbi:827_t:CDS:2 [Cetraspora pellucida]|uniref:827_t:CDS:1 n=1 Tax=Cetraspora pellucida TaxID=1433469 RepID=A0A9N9HFJ6_9GLOM|nr:827_t:CDS:2 [Cetraspora pellucida]
MSSPDDIDNEESTSTEISNTSCKYCPQQWLSGDISTFKMHIVCNCSKAPIEILEESFELNHEVFKEKGKSDNTESNSENIVGEQPNYNYDVDSLVDEIFI